MPPTPKTIPLGISISFTAERGFSGHYAIFYKIIQKGKHYAQVSHQKPSVERVFVHAMKHKPVMLKVLIKDAVTTEQGINRKQRLRTTKNERGQSTYSFDIWPTLWQDQGYPIQLNGGEQVTIHVGKVLAQDWAPSTFERVGQRVPAIRQVGLAETAFYKYIVENATQWRETRLDSPTGPGAAQQDQATQFARLVDRMFPGFDGTFEKNERGVCGVLGDYGVLLGKMVQKLQCDVAYGGQEAQTQVQKILDCLLFQGEMRELRFIIVLVWDRLQEDVARALCDMQNSTAHFIPLYCACGGHELLGQLLSVLLLYQKITNNQTPVQVLSLQYATMRQLSVNNAVFKASLTPLPRSDLLRQVANFLEAVVSLRTTAKMPLPLTSVTPAYYFVFVPALRIDDRRTLTDFDPGAYNQFFRLANNQRLAALIQCYYTTGGRQHLVAATAIILQFCLQQHQPAVLAPMRLRPTEIRCWGCLQLESRTNLPVKCKFSSTKGFVKLPDNKAEQTTFLLTRVQVVNHHNRIFFVCYSRDNVRSLGPNYIQASPEPTQQQYQESQRITFEMEHSLGGGDHQYRIKHYGGDTAVSTTADGEQLPNTNTVYVEIASDPMVHYITMSTDPHSHDDSVIPSTNVEFISSASAASSSDEVQDSTGDDEIAVG